MAMTITVDSVDITNYVDVSSITIESVADTMVAICRFTAHDHTGTIDIEEKDAISIVDGATTLYAGEVSDIDESQHGLTRDWHVACQDYNIYLDETVIDLAEYAQGNSDADIIDDLFTTYRPDIDATTSVAELDASMEAVVFAGMTLRECLDDIARRTGGRYYVDFDLYLHWFSSETNPASWNLSSTPNGFTLFGYGGFKRSGRSAPIVNQVYVLGEDISGWVEDEASVALYGERQAVSRDARITTEQGITDRGNAILDRYDLPRSTYELWTEHDGLRAGMSIEITNSTWAITTQTFYIRKIRMICMDKTGDLRRYYLTLGHILSDYVRSARDRNRSMGAIWLELGDMHDAIWDATAPSAPDALDGDDITTGVSPDADGHQIAYIVITWSEVADEDLDHYEVQLSSAADFSTNLLTRIHPAGGDRTERFEGLQGNTTYYVRVRAVDWTGNVSTWDYGEGSAYSPTSARDTTAPGQVAGLSATGSRTLIALSWTANSESDLAQYEIQRADDSSGSPGTYATIAVARVNYFIDMDFTDEEIAAEDTFWYRVRAVDASGNAGTYSTAASGSPGLIADDHLVQDTTPPGQVAGLSADASRTLIALSWTANSESDLAQYEIQRADDSSGSPGTYATIAVARLNYFIDMDFTDEEIAAEDTFWYRVRAVDTSGNAGTYSTATSTAISRILDDHIAANTITAASIAANTITAAEIAANTITAAEIAANTITAAEIAANTITAAEIAANTITAAEIASGAVDTDELATDAVTAEKIDVSTLSAISTNMGTLTNGEIRMGVGEAGVDFTGFRIYSSYVGGFNADDLQAGIRASDGLFVFGDGAGTIGADGLELISGTLGNPGAAAINFENGSVIYEWFNEVTDERRLELQSINGSSDPSSAELNAYSWTTGSASTVHEARILAETDPSGDVTAAFEVLDNSTAYTVTLSLNDAALETNVSVFINETANANQTIGLTINQESADDEILTLKSSDVTHGITGITETDTYGLFRKLEATSGGLLVRGLKDADGAAGHALFLEGDLGEAADTTKTTSGIGVISLQAAVQSGTGLAAVGSNGNLAVIRNYGTTRFIFDAEGSAHADVEWTTYDDYDDLAMVNDLEAAMVAHQDPVKAEFAEFLRYNRDDLEQAGIVHFDDAKPGHAMLNTTKLSMLLVGALRQIGTRLDGLERQLQSAGL